MTIEMANVRHGIADPLDRDGTMVPAASKHLSPNAFKLARAGERTRQAARSRESAAGSEGMDELAAGTGVLARSRPGVRRADR